MHIPPNTYGPPSSRLSGFPCPASGARQRGFALIVTLSLMILLTVIAVGLLSLSAISLRGATSGEAEARAFANARLAVLMAIGELQKHAGDDRRITADASILPDAGQPHLVGAWDSWTPDLAAKPAADGPDYATSKVENFRSWLVSSPDPKLLEDRAWSATEVDPKWPLLFTLERNGFDLSGMPVSTRRGSYSWAVTQENTKAKLNVPGPDEAPENNVALHAQRRPSLALADDFKQPDNGWNLRAGRVLSLGQVALDTALSAGAGSPAAAGASYTVHSQGLLTDAVHGGLKTDMNLGFGMNDSDFARSTWDGVANPFRSSGGPGNFTSPNSFGGQRALFMPLVENPIVSINTDYWPANVAHRFYAAAVPTFDHLRSFYRSSYHLYGGGTPTVAERGPDHVAVKIPNAGNNTMFGPGNPPSGKNSQLSVRPVLNRMVYLLSATLAANNQVQLVMTPVISLWNPYNTVLEIEGAVAYPWMDLPFQLAWEFRLASGTVGKPEVNMSMMMGKQFEAQQHGRSVNPYFLCEITANGDGNTSTPIRFEPGEVRVFTPASQTPVLFNRTGTNKERTVRMRPVNDIGQMNTKGGLLVPMSGGVKTNGTPHGFTYVVKTTDKISLVVKPSQQGAYHYFVSLEDATRIKDNSDTARGQAISEVQILGFASAVSQVSSPVWTYADLKTTSQPFAVLETFHRTALQSIGGQPIADLIYTTNPRHASINHQLASGTFSVAPHFQSTIRGVSDFSGAIQTSIDGRRSYWGPSHSASGKNHLPFFEIPREPLLSLAGFQHADLAASTFSAANQFGNSWASPYLAREKTGKLDTRYASTGVPVYDTSYLANETLWDSFFFSGAAPAMEPGSSGNPSSAWKNTTAMIKKDLKQVLGDFVADPIENPLSNSRMRLVKGSFDDGALVNRLTEPAGCTRIAAHLTVDGAFNVNSTDVAAWTAQLSGLRGEKFRIDGGNDFSVESAAFPRFRHPTGAADDNWNGFRTLDDGEIRTFAENIVEEIQKRGPFLSLAEFVNRRVEDSELGKAGCLQAAIDAAGFNQSAKQATFSPARYPADAQDNIITDTGVGIPGYLTQADVLQSLAPVITCRSDTFIVRGYGEAKDASGNVTARSWCEAIVQRMPDFTDPSDAADTAVAELSPVNRVFGRRFEVVSFRRVPSAEIQ